MRKVWQRRKCMARGGFLHIYHSDVSTNKNFICVRIQDTARMMNEREFIASCCGYSRDNVTYFHESSLQESLEPTKLNLLTCQVKLPRLPTFLTTTDDGGGGGGGAVGTSATLTSSRRYFDLVSSAKNRTYHFQVEDDAAFEGSV